MSSKELSITLVMDNTASASNDLLKVLNKFPGLCISPEDFALVLGVDRERVYEQIQKGALPSVKFGRRRLIHKHDVFIYARPRRN